ncbi:MAG: Hypothetical radical SAM family enzyme in heat shock gene cluster, similarity with CPO of BS HemN-type [uncultured Campylobacterales bacterium]|uniref:Heme chaperone HemW n=1 Tax=uncultured Campylobacterales bacterium TaxID=352960 RepID=A0A6S6THA2_9BACT|nr:MAG: Hypothetical radical SAM family enzyme in heat shock gene cluster, similarity with CPO of BS HemN-type [uncultured Campylobacterales bacterium]
MLLYIHIPFCDVKCPYCAFSSFVDKLDLQQNYTTALIKQFKYDVQKHNIKEFKTIFIGGGTPSQLDIKYLEQIFNTISPYIKSVEEITIEANPNSSSKQWLQDVKDLGVTRVSFGTQSFHPEKLKFLGRKHSRDDGINALTNASLVGIKNISSDLIYECDIDNEALLKEDIELALSLNVNHISAYSLTIEKNTPFYKTPEKRKDNTNLAKFVIDKISQKLPMYEISNFGTHKCKHNLGYWRYEDYLGVGNSAVGCINNTRIYQTKGLNEYIKDPIKSKQEILNTQDINLEKIFLGFRSVIGVDINILSPKQQKRANILVDENKLYFQDNIFYNKDFLLADEISLYVGQ